ncbi:uncharacterized protein SAPINGB_P001273 [Magnusiomyces paraingens]|uniref:HRQ family protein 2 n=1 Tax=Magnusiomyces paraingens TaxID=2606893 RepID=A0A5E8B6W6_9ASCO|nr:uncharacterized protein SAPINGB_P001273 [Saprochaete ingens]VVT46558.1 unnamed protein product [Saprochaete ingens]
MLGLVEYFLLISSLALLFALISRYISRTARHRPLTQPTSSHATTPVPPFTVPAVDQSFDWSREPPRPYRPYKSGPFHLTMGLQKLPTDDWLLLDREYVRLTTEKRRVTEANPLHTVLMSGAARDALVEAYTFCLDYLTMRYPQYFMDAEKNLHQSIDEKMPPYPCLYNAIHDEYIPKDPKAYLATLDDPHSEESYKHLIRILVRTMEDDFLILIREDAQTPDSLPQYILRCGSFSFPTGFDPAQKMNTPLAEIHKPVPFYRKKIGSAMDKFFVRIKPGAWVQRFNWGVQTHTDLYAPESNHPAPGEMLCDPEDEPDDFDYSLLGIDAEKLDFTNGVFLRCERQCLLRLPQTKALLFTIRTYLTPLAQIRNQEPPENSENMIAAIENLPPAMAHYKLAEEWGPAVISYLKHETDGI